MVYADDSHILQALAEASEALIQGLGSVRGKPCVAAVTIFTDMRNILSGPVLDFFIEVKLVNSADMTWSIEIEWTSQWSIRADIRLNRYSEGEFIAELGEWSTPNPAEFIEHLHEAARLTLESLHAFDFCTIEVDPEEHVRRRYGRG